MRTVEVISALSIALLLPLCISAIPADAQGPVLLQTHSSHVLAASDLAVASLSNPAENSGSSGPAENLAPEAGPEPLPDAPSALKMADPSGIFSLPCSATGLQKPGSPDVDSGDGQSEPCLTSAPNPYRRFLNYGVVAPLTPRQKGYLAVREFIDPANLITITGTAAFTIGLDSHTAYGPGWKGFGRNTGYSLLQDATGDFFGTFLIPSIAHQDPRYYRLVHASIARRTVYAISRTFVSRSDDGRTMPNYSTILTYPISAEIGNLYVPGVNGNGPATVRRVMIGYATDPIDNLITEFLPDLASHIHINVIFVQRVLNQVGSGQMMP